MEDLDSMAVLTPLSKEDFQAILNEYNLGEYESHKHFSHALSNTVYKVKTSKKTVILKLFEHGKRDVINLEIKIMALLEREGLSPKLFKTKKGEYLSHYKKLLIIQEYFEGRHVQRFNNQEARRFGVFIGELHKNLKRLDKEMQAHDLGFQFKKNGSVYDSLNINLDQEFKWLNKALKSVKEENLKIGIIHGDLSSSNILKNKKGLFMLCDWDDARKDFLVYDIAVLIGNFMVKPSIVYRNQIREFLKSYQKLIKLNNDEKRATYYFVLHSLLSGLEYASKQKRIHKDENINKWMLKQEKKYITIKNLGLEKFLSLF
ncbi:phosphotransferase [Candidatus Woesearchaeota archaeon]|nr:phosphotransferase [Candidatus Woesearchaeota archaeon]